MCCSFGMGSLAWTCTNQTTSWLVHNLSTFGAWTNHVQTRTHKTHYGLDLGETITFPFIIYFVFGHGTNTQMSFCPGTFEWDSRNFGGP
jgi:hypothetical protein